MPATTHATMRATSARATRARTTATATTARARATTTRVAGRRPTRCAVSASSDAAHAEATGAIDWHAMGFGLTTTAYMFKATCELGGEWVVEGVVPYGDLSLSPSSAVLNYGQGVFEGMKAFRTSEGELLVFRPDENAKRCEEGAGRMSMPAVPRDLFRDAVLRTVSANAEYVPPVGMGSLYLRPLLIGTGAILGLGPAPSYTFLVYCSPVASYFKGGQLTPIDLTVEETYHRAAPGGSGSTKCIGNYSPVLKVQLEAKKRRFLRRHVLGREGKQVHRGGELVQLFLRQGENHLHAGVARHDSSRDHAQVHLRTRRRARFHRRRAQRLHR